MEAKVRISAKDVDRLKEESIFHLSKLTKTGIIEIADIGGFSYPITAIHAYLYLQSQIQSSAYLSAELIGFVDEIVTNRESLFDRSNPHSEDSPNLLDKEIIEAILTLYPKAIERYRIEEDIKAPNFDKKQGRVFVSEKNIYGIGNIQNLCISVLSNAENKLTNSQRLTIIKDVLLPIYFGTCTAIDSRLSLEAIKRAIAVHRANHPEGLEEQLSRFFVSFYLHYWAVQFGSNSLEYFAALERQFTLLEVIHHSTPYPGELVRSLHFRLHLKDLLQFSGENRGSVHLLAIKVYERSAACLGETGSLAQVFIKIFNILSCYGSHLVKDVWGCFYGLVEGPNSAVFQKLELIDIVLGKLEHHENSNVIKNCLHQLLKNEQSNRIFELTPTVVYNSLIRMLNLGAHYLDCMFHMDSKMYPLIAAFFLRFYNSSPAPARLEEHLTWLLQSILAKTNFDHALIALLAVFPQQKHKTTFLGLIALNNTKPLLAAAYSRFPIRKRFQMIDSLLGLIANNMDRKEIKVPHLLEYFSTINEEYLIEISLNKMKAILDVYSQQERELWATSAVEEVAKEVHDRLQGECVDLEDIYNKIKMVELYQRLYQVRFVEYENYFIELIKQYGDSRYKNLQQRHAIITIYALIKDNLIARLKTSNQFVPHLDAVLNSIALYSQLHLHSPSEPDCKREATQIVGHLFRRSYGWVEGEEFKERQGERVVLARMLEWASDRLDEEPLALDIILEACRSRIVVLIERRKSPHLYIDYEHLFEETLYDLFDQLSALESNPGNPSKCSNLSRDKQLRLRVLLTTILLHDGSHRTNQAPPRCGDIGEFIDCYDFQSYEEVCWLIQALYSTNTTAFASNREGIVSEEEAASLAKQLDLLLENMVHNLEYSLGKKEIVAISECTMDVMLSFAYASGTFSQSLVDFCLKLVRAGESYLIFQRVVAVGLASEIFLNFKRLSHLNCDQLMPLVIAVLTIEQYRGFDSAVYLAQENSSNPLYCAFNANLESNYQGVTPRFLAIHAFRQVLGGDLGKQQMQLLEKCILAAFEVCMSQVAKEKMFLSGRNKLKLQLWQFLLVFPPHLLPAILGRQQFDRLLLRCIEAIGHNLISQIRYYSEMFLMRVLTCESNFALLSGEALRALQGGLQTSVGNLNRTIAYVVVSGILIKHISRLGESHPHFAVIKEDFVSLYNCLLTYVGSSVAYFRGLSQFFCLEFTTGCLETKYVSILRENFLMDKDAEQLIGKLRNIMNGYMGEIVSWDVGREVLRKAPNNNRNVVSETYYMDILKQFSTELAKINKNMDGFTAYRYIWRKNVAKGEVEEDLDEEVAQGQEELPAEEQEDDIFQRKIDPTLDYLYGQDCKSQLKLMVTSSKSQALLGHLARTGEIFGIEELIVPSRKVIEMDQFKSISVTAERWLNISDLGAEVGGRPTTENILKSLIRFKSEGFEVVKLSKWRGGNGLSRPVQVARKCVLVLDQEDCLGSDCSRLVDWELQVGRHLSLHVEASIFIWSYFKQHVSRTGNS